jgi:hypothetical protein
VTGLEAESVELIVAGQAFHWFDAKAARKEFFRVLRPPKWVALFWNTRMDSGGPFAEAYESLLTEFGTDYEMVRHDRVDSQTLRTFFGGRFSRRSVPNTQDFDLDGLEGRLRSSSYTPPPEHHSHAAMMSSLRALFEGHEIGGRESMTYETEIYAGQLGRAFGNVWPVQL